MLQVTETQLLIWVSQMLLPLFRIAALITTAPILSESSTPARVKIGLSVLIAALVGPQLPHVQANLLSLPGAMLVGRQLVIGAAMGFTMRLAFSAVQYSGDLIGLNMGLGFALLVDSESNDQTPVIGSLLNYLAMLAFLSVNGHLIMLAAVIESFARLPLEQPGFWDLDWRALALQGQSIFSLGLHLALPLIAALLVTNLALGVLTRAAPQLNLFSVGFPITLLVGFLGLIAAMPLMMPMIDQAVMASINAALG